MDRRRTDAEGGRVVHRERRTRKLAVVVALQNVLVTVSLVVTLYVYLENQTPRADQASEDNVHIGFKPISNIKGNVTLQFSHVHSNKTMSLADERKDQIYISCTGPYVLYMYLCYNDWGERKAGGMLQLQVVGRETPVSTFNLNAPHEVCRGLHSIAYLRAKEKVSLHLSSSSGFEISNASVGLSYLLGSRCDF